jgi:hypothetical protein
VVVRHAGSVARTTDICIAAVVPRGKPAGRHELRMPSLKS